MAASSSDYYLPRDALTGATMTARLPAAWSLIPGEASTRTLTLLDTFDWAVHAAGGWLSWHETDARCWLRWSRDGAGKSGALEQPLDARPAFVAELPDGALRAALLRPSGGRRLLPLVRIETFCRNLRLCDGQGRTLCALQLLECRWCDAENPSLDGAGRSPSTRIASLRARVRIQPLKGAQVSARKIRRMLVKSLDLEPVRASLFEDALAAQGRHPGEYCSKFSLMLDPGMSAEAATRAILRELCTTLAANVAGARAQLDPEFLHDLRVATRRTRSALSQIKGVLPDGMVADFRARFAWLQQVTGPVRDLDVYLDGFDGYRETLPQTLRPGLDAVRTYLEQRHVAEQCRLAETLGGARFKQLLADWHQALEAPVPAPARACEPIKPLADERLWKMVRRVRREGRAISPDSPPEALHELRKSCKKLRYLMEFFASLYPEKVLRRQIKQLKVLLDHLGAFQDLSVQTDWLHELAARMHEEGAADVDTVLAIGALIARLLERQERLRRDFDTVFEQWLHARNQRQLHALFVAGERT